MSRTDDSGDALAPPAPADDRPLLHVRGLTKSFGAHTVLDGVDFEVRRGEVVALIGPSGSGKTTVLRSLNGLETPEAGVLSFEGGPEVDFAKPVGKAKRKAAKQVRDTAAELLNLYAQRAARMGRAFKISQHDLDAFAEGFGFEETGDQRTVERV